MLLLYETPGGIALFKVLDESKVKNIEDVQKIFSNPSQLSSAIQLKTFKKFQNTQEALKTCTAIVESKLSSWMKTFLEDEISEKKKETLAVCDKILGNVIAEKLGLKTIHNETIFQLFRGV